MRFKKARKTQNIVFTESNELERDFLDANIFSISGMLKKCNQSLTHCVFVNAKHDEL